MALHLKDLIAKAESKGIKPKQSSPVTFLKPWQEESVLFEQNPDFQSTNKPTTNRQQTEYTTDNKLGTNWVQTEYKTDNKLGTNRQQTEYTTDNKLSTNWVQTEYKPGTSRQFSELSGLQKTLIHLLYQECKISRSKTTGNLTLEHISSSTKHLKNTVKITLQRLERKNLIKRISYKNGRGGWTQYSLDDSIFRDLLQHETDNKLSTNWVQTGNKLGTQPSTQPSTSASSSSSSYNIINTTTTKLPEEWLKIDLEEASSFGLTQNHLFQLYRTGGYDPKIIEDSIRHFCFDLEHNKKAKSIKTNPLSYFMAILKRVGVYAAPDNYESPRDRALRLYVEKEKIVQEKKAAIEKECFNLEFEKWLGQLSENEKSEIIPSETKKTNLAAPKMAALRVHFEKFFWQSIKNEILNKIFKETGNGN